MTRLTTEKKIEKAEQILDFIEKRDIAGGKREKTAIELQEYDNAKAIRKSAIKTIKNKRIVFGNRSMEAINAIRQIDIQDLTPEQIRQYNEALSEVVAPKLKPTPETRNAFFDKIRQIDYTPTEKKIGDVKSIEEYIDAVTAMEINNSVDLSNAMKDLRKAKRIADNLLYADKITAEEHNKIMEKLDADLS